MHPVEAIEKIPKPEIKILSSRKQKSDRQISQAKKDDIKSMLRLMPMIDRQYYNSIGITEN